MMGKILRALKDLWSQIYRRNGVAVTYMNEIPNVGDLIGPYLVEKITGKDVHRAHTKIFPTLLTVGSVLGSATKNSSVWGAGSIDGKPVNTQLDTKKIFAVRGKMTLSLIRETLPIFLDIPLGDPALLMPSFFNPTVAKRYDIGIIPHYADFDLLADLANDAKIMLRVLDVRSDPEAFIEDLLECRQIISSSLHGLILADAYGIPNVWARFSDRLVGGEWKFHDYYSVTDESKPVPTEILSARDLVRVMSNAHNTSRVAKYEGSLERLLDAFPLGQA